MAASAMACAQPALAQVSQEQYAYYRDPALPAYPYPGAASATLSVPVTASVGGVCGFRTGNAPNATLTYPNIDTTAWSGQVPFIAECTAPWRIAVSSQNGALRNTATVPTGYQNRAPYTVSLNVASDAGTVTAACPVAQIDQALGSSTCNFKGTASTSNGLLIGRSFGLSGSYIQVAAPAYAGPDVLVSGNYTDTLVVTISPAS
ncbi:MAG TPA: hypothetical protein VFV30_00920 [Novosphingobium sp.]|nr:hypothetical protein [Novosphingobium sp.]